MPGFPRKVPRGPGYNFLYVVEVQVQSLEQAKLLVTDAAQDEAAKGSEYLLNTMGQGVQDYVAENPWAIRRACGTAIHNLVAEALKGAGFQYFTKGPDFLIMIGGSQVWIELTTEGGISEHMGRANRPDEYAALYAVASFVTYVLLL
jgi:hypothetical protein